jgi:hypothetical protein
MARFNFSPFPISIQSLIGAVVAAATQLGFHGRAKVTKEGEEYVIALRVRDRIEVALKRVDEMTERERKRRARSVRG